LFDRYKINAEESLFIDDNLHNIEGAKAVGMNTVVFTSPEQLLKDLHSRHITPFSEIKVTPRTL
jgi:2-haloacid dehalogenase